MALRPGDSVEHFVIVSALGEGGMGQVFLARDTRLQRSVALKIVHAERAPSGSGASSGAEVRLMREAQAAAALEHPNVVTIYEVGQLDAGEDAGSPFIAMELVKGTPLRRRIGDFGVPVGERIRWLLDVASALAAAHRSGLIHRDIKPENVMIRDDGVVKVLDFGLAKRTAQPLISSAGSTTDAPGLANLTSEGVALGTPYYMAPEQMRCDPLDGRADQFAWGVMAYELLSGAPPWGAKIDVLELVSRLLTATPPALHLSHPEVPAAVSAAIMRTLAKSRDDRFATMEELIVAIQPHASGAAHPTPPPRSAPLPADALALTTPADALALTTPSHPLTPTIPKPGEPLPVGNPRRRLLLRAAAIALLIAGAAGVRALTHFGRAAPTASIPRECSVHGECVQKAGGKPALCNPAGRCALVENEQCKAMYEPSDLRRDDTVWIGAMFPLSGDSAWWGRPSANAVELARRDFARIAATFVAPPGARPLPPLALVVCDDRGDAQATALHLAQEIGVPAVIGFSQTILLATSVFVPRNVVMVETISISPRVAAIPHGPDQPRMVFRTTYNVASMSKPIAAIVSELETRFRSTRNDTLRVALLRGKKPEDAALAESIFAELRFNGKPALENLHSYREFVFDGSDVDTAAAEVAAFAPHVVIHGHADWLESIERVWPKDARDRPCYIAETLDATVARFIGSNADRRKRFYALSSVSTTRPNARFVLHYNETFPEPVTRSESPNTSYDAFYLVALASYARGAGPVTGPSLSRGITRLVPPGAPIDVGPSGILAAIAVLQRGANVDLNGATGRLDFDASSGDAAIDFALVCPDVDAAGKTIGGMETGIVFDSASGRFNGPIRCQ